MEFQIKDFFPLRCITHNMFWEEKRKIAKLSKFKFDFILSVRVCSVD